MSTRNVDKGAKEDFKMAMRAQVARWNEPIDELIIRFLQRENELIRHSLMSSTPAPFSCKLNCFSCSP